NNACPKARSEIDSRSPSCSAVRSRSRRRVEHSFSSTYVSDPSHPTSIRVRPWLLRHLRLGCVVGLVLAGLDLVLIHSIGVAELAGAAPLAPGVKLVGVA